MIGRPSRTINDGIARPARPTEREQIRIAVYAQSWRYRHLPGGNEPGGPFASAGEMMQQVAAKRAREVIVALAARFGDDADLDAYALPRTDRERRGVFLKQPQALLAESGGALQSYDPAGCAGKLRPGAKCGSGGGCAARRCHRLRQRPGASRQGTPRRTDPFGRNRAEVPGGRMSIPGKLRRRDASALATSPHPVG